jgi:hypothetical protein
MGDAIRNEKVTPNGTPDSTKPKNKGIAEHEQNGVTIPSNDANMFPVKSDLPSRIFRVFSGVKYERIIPTKKIISVSRSITFGNSKTKNLKVSVRRAPFVNANPVSINQSVTG